MTNKRSTKKALLMSALSLFVCVSMLIGSTFAWFTDSVISAGNTIQSGTLKVDLVDANDKSMEGEVIEFVAADGRAQNEILWEPGCTYKTEPVYVVNKGNLALQYKMGINGIDGDAKLLEAIEWTATLVDAEGKETETELSELQGDLLAGEKSQAIVLSGHMKEEAGNEYQGLTVEGISVTVFATQLTSEKDSFDENYDAMATVDTVEELNKALEENSVSIVLGSDIELAEGIVIAAGQEVAIDLAGYTLSQTKACTEHYAMITNRGTLTINDSVGIGKISFTDSGEGDPNFGWGSYTIANYGTKLTVNGGTIEHLGEQNPGNGQPNVHMYCAIWQYSGSTVINGGTISTPTYRSVRLWKGDMTVNDGNFEGQLWVQCIDNTSKLTINGGNFAPRGNDGSSVYVSNASYTADISITGGNFTTKIGMGSAIKCVTGGTFAVEPAGYVADGYVAIKNEDGTYNVVDGVAVNDTSELAQAIGDAGTVVLAAGEYSMPSSGTTGDVSIVGTENAIIDLTNGAYMQYASSVTIEGVTIKTGIGYANGNGSDYAALYASNTTYINCTFEGPMRLGGDGTKFIDCTFTGLGSSYVWNMQWDTSFEGCTFETDGKALLLYADGSYNCDGVANVSVKNCNFTSTTGAKAGAIANQNCAAIEIHNYGTSINLETSGNTYDSNFSGEWRIKTFENNGKTVTVNGVAYTTIAIDGKTMTIDADKNVTVNE